MNVLITAYGYSQDGFSESATAFRLAKQLSDSNDITVFTRNDKTKGPNIHNIPIKYFRNSGGSALKLDYFEFIIRCYRNARGGRNQLIHHISPISFRYPNPLCLLGVPFIWGPIGGSIPYPKGFEKRQKKEPLLQQLRKLDKIRLYLDPTLLFTLQFSKKIIVTSSAASNLIPKKYQSKVLIIPEGIDNPTDNFASFNGNYIFSSGRLVPYKAFDLLIHAFFISTASNKLKLYITGDGPERAKLKKMIFSLGLEDKVKLLGRVSLKENKELMKRSRFCVFPALNEAFGHVNLEAMSQKKALIVTRNGGPADLVKNGKTGFSISANGETEYIAKLSEKIDLLFNKPELNKRMGQEGFEYLCKNYSWKVIGRMYEKLYRDIEVKEK